MGLSRHGAGAQGAGGDGEAGGSPSEDIAMRYHYAVYSLLFVPFPAVGRRSHDVIFTLLGVCIYDVLSQIDQDKAAMQKKILTACEACEQSYDILNAVVNEEVCAAGNFLWVMEE